MLEITLLCQVEKARIDFLDQFINHYKKIGVTKFFFICHTELHLSNQEKQETVNYFKTKLLKSGIDNFTHYDGIFIDDIKTQLFNQIVAQHCLPDDWVMKVDIDEFQEYWAPLNTIINQLEKRKQNYIKGEFIDRLTHNGHLPIIDYSQSLFKTFPVWAAVQKIINPTSFVDKIVLSKAWIKTVDGQHKIHNYNEAIHKRPYKMALVHHFKWDETVVARQANRKIFPHWHESENIIKHIVQHKKINFETVEILNPKHTRNIFFLTGIIGKKIAIKKVWHKQGKKLTLKIKAGVAQIKKIKNSVKNILFQFIRP